MTEPTNEQLAQWIEAGLATTAVQECIAVYLVIPKRQTICQACALGLAVIGKYESVEAAISARNSLTKEYDTPAEELADLLGIGFTRADAIESQHLVNEKTAAEIAGMLRIGEI